MNTGIAVIACGMAVGLGLWWMVSTVLTPMARLEPAVARLSPSRLEMAAVDLPQPTGPTSFVDRIGAWAEPTFSGRAGLTTPERDLALLGVRRTHFWGRKVIGALFGLVFPPAASALIVLAGGTMDLVLPSFVGLLLAVMGWLLPDLKVQRAAKRARYDFSLAVAAYLQQVAVLRRASYETTEAMTKAAEISQSWTFRRIQAALFRASLAHVPPWEALNQLSEDLDVPELEAAADIMRSAGESGAGVWSALVARSTAIRRQAMADTQGGSQSATTAMSAPIALMAVVFFLGVLFPALIQLSNV